MGELEETCFRYGILSEHYPQAYGELITPLYQIELQASAKPNETYKVLFCGKRLHLVLPNDPLILSLCQVVTVKAGTTFVRPR
jgi:hypothetical protein